MTTYVALLRAVNVGGTGKLPMADLKALCASAGFAEARTYLASGNVVFKSSASATKVKSILEVALLDYAGKPVGVVVRTASEMLAVCKANPFPDAAPNRTVAIFLDAPPPADALQHATGRRDEGMQFGVRELYVSYGSGMADTKLRIPAAKTGTARNMSTVAALEEISANL
jgi:uncharacterized protein (DUF1697 family)